MISHTAQRLVSLWSMLRRVIASLVILEIFTLFVASISIDHKNECGRRKPIARELIHHGVESRTGEWPWHVALFHMINRAEPSYACGGTIISRRFVLTAAHCTYPKFKARPLKAKEMLVRAGIANIYNLEHSMQEAGVVEIMRHVEFNKRTLEDDIALLKLESEFELTDYVRPLCLWSGSSVEELIIGKRGSSAGWGEDEDHKLSGRLKHVPMLIVSRRRCRDSDPEYYTRFLYDRKMFCAGFRNGSTPASGDSGGGLYIEGKDGTWGLRGILSNGKIEAETRLVDPKSFVVFVDVAYYLPWIRKNTNISVEGEETALFNQDFSTCGLLPEVKQQRPWPWQGEVYRNDSGMRRLCDVAIISELFLVSPAKVYRNSEFRNPSKLILTFKTIENGRYRLLHHQRIGRIIRHEKFDAFSERNNIALLELIAPLKFTEILRPICLWRADPKELRVVDNSNDGLVENLTMNCTLGVNYFCIVTKPSRAFNSTFYLENDELWYLRGLTTKVTQNDQLNNILLLDVARYTGWIENNSVFRTKNLLNNVECSLPFINDYTFISTTETVKCFATLISSSLLLSTASCLDNSNTSDLFGTSNAQTAQVKQIYVHPTYNSFSKSNNLAIVQLNTPLDTTPFCILFDTSRSGSRLRLLLPTQTSKKYFFDFIDTGHQCPEGNLCGHFKGIAKHSGDPHCTESFHGSPLFHDFGDGQGVYLRGLLQAGKADHCEQPELPEVFVDVMFYADWIRETVLGIVARG